jgi:hypothetical protein
MGNRAGQYGVAALATGLVRVFIRADGVGDAERGMSVEATSKSDRMWGCVVGLVASLPVLFPFRVGPAMLFLMPSALSMDNKPSHALYGSTSRPLFLFAQMTGTEGALRIYLRAWRRMIGADPAVRR